MSIEILDGQLLKKMIIAGANLLEKNKDYCDELNVFPVPDGDTGTNMSMTVIAAAKEVQKASDDINEIAKALSSGSLRGARGNSGVILSQLFRGFSKGLKDIGRIDTTIIANAFQKGVETAYKAVMKPKEGTILTVARESASRAIELALETEDIEYFLSETIKHAQETLEKTPDMLPVLKQAGVVDAGGQGLLFILRGALSVLNGTVDDELSKKYLDAESNVTYKKENIDSADIIFGYCTEFIVETNKKVQDLTKIKKFLETIGDSVVSVADDEIIKIHVHTNDPGKALQKGLEYGQLVNIKIDNMRQEHADNLKIQGINKLAKKEELKEVGFIGVSIGSGMTEIFQGLGVDYIIEGGQTMNPSTEDIINAVEKVNAKKIIVLPNNKNIILAAEQAKFLSEDKEIFVVPSKSIPQGISAMINYDISSSIENNLNAMTEALDFVKTAQVTFAVRDTNIEGKEICKDDILGIGQDEILVVGKELELSSKELIDKLVDEDSELITIYYGNDAKEEDASVLASYIEDKYEECEVEVHYGGQPLYYYIISIE